MLVPLSGIGSSKKVRDKIKQPDDSMKKVVFLTLILSVISVLLFGGIGIAQAKFLPGVSDIFSWLANTVSNLIIEPLSNQLLQLIQSEPQSNFLTVPVPPNPTPSPIAPAVPSSQPAPTTPAVSQYIKIEPTPSNPKPEPPQAVTQPVSSIPPSYATLTDLTNLQTRLTSLITANQTQGSSNVNQMTYALAPTQKIDNLGTITISQATISNDLTLGGNLSTAGNLSVSGTQTFTGTANFSGNVGIGATTPTVKLAVQGSANSTASVGSEKVGNNDFATNPDTAWTWGTTWTHDTTNFEADHATSTGGIASVSLDHGGTGYTVNDVLTLSGGNSDGTLTVTTVSSGKITAVSITTAGTGYATGGGKTVTGGTGTAATFTIIRLADDSGTLSQDVSVTVGKIYEVKFTIKNSTAGHLKFSLGGVTSSYLSGNQTTYTQLITTTDTGNLIFTPTINFNGSIDDVSVKELTQSDPVLSLLNSDATAGMEIRSGGPKSYLPVIEPIYNTFIGIGAGRASYHNTTSWVSGGYNSVLGYQALYSNTTGGANSTMGFLALTANTTGSYNSAMGAVALYSNTTGGSNSAVGYGALNSNTTGSYNSGIGGYALRYNTTGSGNSAVGYGALNFNTTGYYNSAMGTNALYSNTTGYNNSAMGGYAFRYNTTGYNNSAIGYVALSSNTTGYANSAMGYGALYSNTTGSGNSAMGYAALYYNTAAASTTAVGYQAARGTAAYSNQGGVYLGYQAGYSAKTDSNYNTLLGYQAGYGITTGSYNIIIGQNVEAASTTASQQLNIGNLIYGTGLYNGSTVSSAPVSGNVGIGTSTPNQLLTVVGTRPSIKLSDYSAGQNLKTWLFSSMGGNLYIGTSTDAYATSTPAALTILNNGNVGISSTSPSQQFSISGLAYIGGAGTSTIENNLYVMGTLRAARSYVGDLVFGNNFLFTESEPAASPQSLILKNQRGEDILSVDENGNLEIKGELKTTQSATGLLAGQTDSPTLLQPFSWFLEQLQQIGIAMANGVIKAKEFISEKITAQKGVFDIFEMKDSVTGETWCIKITNGEWDKIKGTCGETSSPQSISTPAPVPESIPEATSTPGTTSAAEVTATPAVTPTPQPTAMPEVTSTPGTESAPAPEATPNSD